MNFDLRHLIESQEPIIIKIAFLNTPFLERYFSHQRGCQTVDDAALHLRLNGIGIDELAAVDRAYNTMYGGSAASADTHFGNLRYIAAV